MERVGGSPANERNMEEFNDSIGNCDLSEAPFDGSLFTWTNGFLDVVQQGWAKPVEGEGMTKFYHKLRAVKGCLQLWNVQVFGNIFNKVREAEAIMKQREEQFDNGRDTASRAALEEAKAVYARSLTFECKYWRQKAGIKWLQVGDANLSYFHSRCRQRRNFNFVARIKDQLGTWLEDIQDIRRSAVEFFSSLFASEQHGWHSPGIPFTVPQLFAADNGMLSALSDMAELKEVVFALEADSAPGLDGFGAGFYQACWDIIKSDLLEAVQVFFQGMRLPRSFTSTSIILLPKIAGAIQWKDFRPISLCNVCSKIISKIVSDRLGRVLPTLVSPWQTSFVPGWGITDNILLTQELFSVLVNGEAAGFFKSSRGVRQGDPVSPHLLVLVAEFLGRGLHHLLDGQPGRYFVLAVTPVLYLAFADDMLIFTRCSEECLNAIKAFLLEYQEASGQRVNVNKSSFFLVSGATLGQEQLVTRVLGFHRQFFPFTYLGAPIYKGRRRGALFDGIVSKMRTHLGHWSTKLLSFGGKLVLARHVLASLPMYLLQVLNPPKAVLTRLGKIWGLGFRSFKDMARAFAAKLWWRLRLGDSIWAEFMHAKYIKGIHPSEASAMRSTDIWRRIEAIRPIVEQNIRWCLGKGLVDFWKDRWVLHEPLESVVGRSEGPLFLVSEFITRDGWDEMRLAQWVSGFVIHAIKDIPLDLSQKDRMVWLPSPTGCFSVKSAWEVLRQRRHQSLVDSLLWPSVLPAKMSFFAWRLVRNFLPLNVTLRSRGLSFLSRCGCCDLEEEALLHVFLTGPLGRANKLRRSHFTGDADCDLLQLIKAPPRRRTPCVIAWEKPPPGLLKFNSDASVNHGRATSGGLVRDCQGLIFAFYKEFGEQDVLEAESMALLFGLQLCLQRGFRPSLVEVDSKALVQLVVSGVIAKWPLCNILRKVRGLLEGFSAFISHIFREANSPADRLAAIGAVGVRVYDHVQQLPAIVRASLILDSRGVPGVRWLNEEG
ncbi:uncharacterized protein LOC113760083 [Coffea eugenioides]|uniref:uncharacterized protein LOC113760083 n=1 Tax=Coffea eugenioides TaxID=49369 RepID=UPI000F606C84|nr:uncharacterized protein LOC113760083 [Coffea eugenioides]